METSEVLNLAADRIERDGWYSMYHGGSSTGNCASNVIADVEPYADNRAHDALIAHIGGIGLGDIFRWNDDPERTAAEVIETLRACALIESAREEQDAVWRTYADAVTV